MGLLTRFVAKCGPQSKARKDWIFCINMLIERRPKQAPLGLEKV